MFVFLAFIIAIPAIVFSAIAQRVKQAVYFWLGAAFSGLLFLVYAIEYEYMIYIFSNFDSLFFGFFLIILLAIPIYFLVASKNKKGKYGDPNITDDYLNSIINSDEKELTDKDFE